MLSVTIPNSTPSQKTPVLPNMRRNRDAAERSEQLAQELGKGVAGNHLSSP